MADMLLVNLVNSDAVDIASANGTNVYDIVKDYDWTLTPSNKRNDVPYIELTEFEQDIAGIYAELDYWLANAVDVLSQQPSDNPYKNLYHAVATKTSFKLPYFGTSHHNVQQSWTDSEGGLMKVAKGSVETAIGYASMVGQLAGKGVSPGFDINKPQMWKSIQKENYSIEFTLFNILTNNAYVTNKRFINRLLLSTLHNQRNAVLATPPAIFMVDIPGIRNSPAAVIQNLDITNVGQMNLIDGYNIPDAYSITINILELVPESRQIFYGTMNKKNTKVIAINQIPVVEGIFNRVVETFVPTQQKQH